MGLFGSSGANFFNRIEDRVEDSFHPDQEFKQSLDPKKALRESFVPFIGRPTQGDPVNGDFTKQNQQAGDIKQIAPQTGRADLTGAGSQFNEPTPPFLASLGFNNKNNQ